MCTRDSTNMNSHALSRNNMLLTSVQHVIDHTYLCGYTPCHEMLDATVTWLLGKGLDVTGFAAVVILLFPTLFVLILRSNMIVLADRRMRQLYNAPYKTIHYGASHPWSGEDDGAFARAEKL